MFLESSIIGSGQLGTVFETDDGIMGTSDDWAAAQWSPCLVGDGPDCLYLEFKPTDSGDNTWGVAPANNGDSEIYVNGVEFIGVDGHGVLQSNGDALADIPYNSEEFIGMKLTSDGAGGKFITIYSEDGTVYGPFLVQNPTEDYCFWGAARNLSLTPFFEGNLPQYGCTSPALDCSNSIWS